MSIIKKLFVGLAVVAMVFGVGALSVSALTASDVAALVAALGLTPQQAAVLTSLVTPSTGGSMSGYTFNTDLTVGSRGGDVSALQQILINGGYLNIAAPTEYFGSATQAALAAWQRDNGISPAAGYFGPITRAKLNSMSGSAMPTPGMTYPAGCSSSMGFSTTTGMPCSTPGSTVPGCVPGAMFSSTTGQSCTGAATPVVVADGTDGSVTISYNPFAPASQTLKKGESKNVIAVKLQATGGNVAIQRFDVNFSARPWLYFSKVELLDMTGNVLATKMLSSQSDATEVQVGSNYQVRFDGINHAVAPGSDSILVVRVTTLAASDKFPATVYAAVPANAIRTMNGKGYTDSIGLTSGQGSTPDSTNGNVLTLTSTGSAADIYTSIGSGTPPTGFVTVSAGTTQTTGVTLGVFQIKSQNVNSTLNSLSFNLNNSTGVATTSLFSNVQLIAGGQTYGASSLSGSTMFTNMTVPLPLDQWVTLTLKADVAGADVSNGISASSTLVKASISGVDANFNSLTITNASNVTSNNLTFLQSGIAITSAPAPVVGNCQPLVANGPDASCLVTFTVTLQNTSNNLVYISRTPGIALATSTNPSSVASSTITLVTANPSAGEVPGDNDGTGASFAIPVNGSRTFTFTGSIGRNGTATGPQSLSITAIKFGTGSANGTSAGQNAATSLTAGLGNLIGIANF